MKKFLLLVAVLSLCILAGYDWYQQRPATMTPISLSPIEWTTVSTYTVDLPPVVSPIDYSLEAQLPPYIPEDQIPFCTDADLTPSAQATAAPRPIDNAAPLRCRSRVLDVNDNIPGFSTRSPNAKPLTEPLTRPIPRPQLSVDGTNVHVLIPCATLTPYTDYRDFMKPGTISMGGTILLNWKGIAQPEPTNPPDMHVLPPAEATLVFDNSEGCE